MTQRALIGKTCSGILWLAAGGCFFVGGIAFALSGVGFVILRHVQLPNVELKMVYHFKLGVLLIVASFVFDCLRNYVLKD